MIHATGLEDVVIGPSAISDINGQTGQLIYSGYDIDDLAVNATFEEVTFLLWHGRLPNQAEYDRHYQHMVENRDLPAQVVKLLFEIPQTSRPLDVLRTVVSLLSNYDQDSNNNTADANLRKATRLTARLPSIITAIERIRSGELPIKSDPSLGHAANFLYMLTGTKPNKLHTDAMNTMLILHADHELNASTFTGRVVVSTLADMYAGVVGAIGALGGALHGGANEEVMKMLLDIGEDSKVEEYIRGLLIAKKRVMGFGHRVYKCEDPRSKHLRNLTKLLCEEQGDMTWYNMSELIAGMVHKEKGLYTNVDFYSASVQYMMGIPIDMFTPVFAASRISGWTAHIMEQFGNNRLLRPRAEYTGPSNLTYTGLNQRL